MKKTVKGMRRTRHLVLGYLERVSSKAFDRYPEELTDLAAKEHGVYALYKGDRLYYVGLAIDLRNRIKHHLRDRHARKWDRFSLYLIRKADHIKELESLILRTADPRGNRKKGKLLKAENLMFDLRAKIRKRQQKEIEDVFPKKRTARRQPITRKWRTMGRQVAAAPLATYVTRGIVLRGYYKGTMYRARVKRSGQIEFRGNLYNSPGGAAHAVTGRSTYGWVFWRYKNESGVWVRLKDLRKK